MAVEPFLSRWFFPAAGYDPTPSEQMAGLIVAFLGFVVFVLVILAAWLYTITQEPKE